MAIVKNVAKAMESMMRADQVRQARLVVGREILAVQPAKLRERQGVGQSDMKAFSQTAISKLERRKDMKLSALIEYLEDTGMGLKISVYRKGAKRSGKEGDTLAGVGSYAGGNTPAYLLFAACGFPAASSPCLLQGRRNAPWSY